MSTKQRDSQLKIFLSSTMKELRDARSVVKRELDKRNINAWVYENDVSAAPDNVVATSLRQVDEADVYVGLFWQSYGKVTIEEYQRAKQTNKPCFVYIREKDCKRDDNLETFLRTEIYDLQKGVTYQYFEDVSELGEQIAEDILVWLVRRHREMTAELQRAHVSQEEMARLQAEIAHLQASSRTELPRGTPVDYLAQQMRAWFQTLNYGFEHHEKRGHDSFEWIINVPDRRRRRYDRILVCGVEGEATVHHVTEMRQAVQEHGVNEGWIVAVRRIGEAARREVDQDRNRTVSCYTFDELIDLDADFSQYLAYLTKEIQGRRIDTTYVPLACKKDELDPSTKKKIATSTYNESNGWIEGYIDRWLADPSKEHISVLGEFGTGKTWFTLHYAWTAMQHYLDACKRGIERPRLPLVIPLRDYAKAVSVESLFSEFFFRKYEIGLQGYSVFEQLNRMGKLLLIFDGFDEMADKVDRQKMINNFWELARTVVPGSKVILTCRTEHFPHAREGRALLNAELQASTASLTGEPPQFEVLELQPFGKNQIQTLLSFHTTPEIAQKVMDNGALVDLARRPVMTDLILEALPAIEAGKPVDMSRVYLYAVQRKMERDISNARTFTSLKDKLYFLCELSWEMLSTDQMSLNYRLFPDRIRKLFGPLVEEQKDLDHWHYDMMGQTMLIRNEDGDYTPAHRSLLEFFVAYKFAAELGILHPDFVTLAQKHLEPHEPTELRDYIWSDYFRYQVSDKEDDNLSLRSFLPEALEHMKETIGQQKITPAVLDLMQKMLISDLEVVKENLINIILQTRGKTSEELGLIGANVVAILLRSDRGVFVGCNLSGTNLASTEFDRANLTTCDLSGANLSNCEFSSSVMEQADLRNVDLTSASFHENNGLYCVSISPDGSLIATGGPDGLLRIWDTKSGNYLFLLGYYINSIEEIFFSPDRKYVGDSSGRVYDLEKKQIVHKIRNLTVVNSLFLHKSNLAFAHVDGNITIWDLSTSSISLVATFSSGGQSANSILFHTQKHSYIVGSYNGLITLWDIEKKEISLQKQCASNIYGLCLSPDETLLAIGGLANGLLLLHAHNLSKIWHLDDIGRIYTPKFTSTGEWIFVGSRDVGVLAVLTKVGINVAIFPANGVFEVAISPDDTFLVSASYDEGTIQFWDIRPFVTIADEPHIPLAEYKPADLSPFFQDPTTWPEWWQKCDLPIPPDRIPNPNFGKCLRTIQYQMNCQGLRLAGAKGLDTIKIYDSKGNITRQKAATWLTKRGAIMKEQSGTRKSKRAERAAGE